MKKLNVMKCAFAVMLILALIISGCGSPKTVEDAVKGAADKVEDAVQEAITQAAEEIKDAEEEVSEPVSEVLVEEEEIPEEIITTQSSNVKEIEMTARRWQFEPSVITAKQGETLRLRIKSLDVTHGFQISEFKVIKNLEPGEEEIIEFVADKKGTFTFACSVFCGSGHGSMKGKLIVE